MNEKLVSVVLITRHGARTPLHLVDGIFQIDFKSDLLDPFVDSDILVKSLDNQRDLSNVLSYKDQKYLNRKLKGGAHVGQLTCVGEEQMFNLGSRLKEKYIKEMNFFNEKYDPSEIYVRSTHLRRTINSAKSVLAGLYQKRPSLKLKTPFLINVNDLETDYLYPNLQECPLIQEKRELIKQSFDFYNENENNLNEYSNFVNNIKNKFNFRVNDCLNPLFVYEFLDEIHSRMAHNLSIPKDVEILLDQANRFASIELGLEMMENLDLNCGKFINLLKLLFKEIVFKDKNNILDYYKLNFFSAHDNTLIALLIVLNQINEENYIHPPYGSDLVIELWKKFERKHYIYFVKLYFNGKGISVKDEWEFNKKNLCKINMNSRIKTTNDVQEEDTEFKMDFSNFIRILSKHSIDENFYKAMCLKSQKES
ncbi:unnamed protein product [Brachionus calyciflorus]|uniref:Uncharacterized protein n=1 Tax=Brachionus calyciflorus TaxID=104777 RepID=A0A813XXA0_9BILA|nr:unnamed protein product [Brachionus calyciflorus]